ncbi:unnamed protein product, partial [Phaeothamnion confervicola]
GHAAAAGVPPRGQLDRLGDARDIIASTDCHRHRLPCRRHHRRGHCRHRLLLPPSRIRLFLPSRTKNAPISTKMPTKRSKRQTKRTARREQVLHGLDKVMVEDEAMHGRFV